MSVPAFATRALALAGQLAGSRDRGPGQGGSDGPKWLLLAVLAPFAAVIAFVLAVVLLLAGAAQQCQPASEPPSGAFTTAPGALGGVAGTGVSRAQLTAVRTGSPYAAQRLTPGTYLATSYGPPWGGIQGAGIATSGGLRIGGGAPRFYQVAVDPGLIGHGRLVYLWPNPFQWTGPFVAADTGGAIQGRRIDFYDWRGRLSQYAWGQRDTHASQHPLHTTAGPDTTSAEPTAPPSASCSAADGPAQETSLALPGVHGTVTIAPLANAPGRPVRPELIAFLERVAGIAGREIVLTTGTNHRLHTSSGRISDHVLGLAGDFGSVANRFPLDGGFGTRLAAAGLRAAGVPEAEAWRLAAAGGGHDVCHAGWRVQVIWRTGDHHDHVHIGLNPGCAFTGVRTFQI